MTAHKEQLVADGALHEESCVTKVPGPLRGADPHQMGPEDTCLNGKEGSFLQPLLSNIPTT